MYPPQQPPQSSPPTPPPYYAPPPRRGGMPGWAWALILGCGGSLFFFVAIFAAILFPVFAQAREKARQASCASNLKQMSIAALSYAQDFDDKLPLTGHWMESLHPYAARPTEDASGTASPPAAAGDLGFLFHCPSAVSGSAGGGDRRSIFGYAYDSTVAARSESALATPNTTLLFYDSVTLTKDASDAGTSLPPKGRHSGSNNIAYGDGHVHWARVGSGDNANE